MKGWTDAEIKQFDDNLKYWEAKKAEYAKGGDAAKAVDAEVGGFRMAEKFRSRGAVQKKVDEILTPYAQQIKDKYPNSKVGYRGSLATDERYNTGGPFDPDSFDVDAYIINNDLVDYFPDTGFRDGRKINFIEQISNQIEVDLKNTILGYGKDKNPFTFRIWTYQEYKTKVIPDGFKNL